MPERAFTPKHVPPDPAAIAAFVRQVDAARDRNRTAVLDGGFLFCRRCHFRIGAAEARARGIHACPRCGSTTDCEYQALNYNPDIPENPLPSPGEVQRMVARDQKAR